MGSTDRQTWLAERCSASLMADDRSHFHYCIQPPGHRHSHRCGGCGVAFVPVLDRGDAYENQP